MEFLYLAPQSDGKIENIYHYMEFFYFSIDKFFRAFYNETMNKTMRKKQKTIFYKYIANDIFDEFQVVAVGKEKCSANKKQEGPFIKNRFVMHYVVSGKGYYNLDGKLYALRAGDVFYIPANHIIFYYPDTQEPWEYFWFEYSGQKSIQLNERAGLTISAPVYHVQKPEEFAMICTSMLHALNDKTDDLTTLSDVYRLFSTIINERFPQKVSTVKSRDDLISQIFTYISANYSNPSLSLTDIASHFNMNASYLSRFFRQTAGLPISKYIIDFRMTKAVSLLKRKDLSIKYIAISVGYSDPLYFSREFSRLFRTSPSSYRKELEMAESKHPTPRKK